MPNLAATEPRDAASRRTHAISLALSFPTAGGSPFGSRASVASHIR